MLPKKNRADKKTVNNIFKEGKFINSPYFTFRFVVSSGARRVSFIVPKSVCKSAVKRNLLRRRGYLAITEHFPSLPSGFNGVFIFKKYEDDTATLSNELKKIIDKLN